MDDEIRVDIFSQFQGETIKRTLETPGEDEIIEYKKGEAFGKGGFSTCYKCINKNTKEIFILKEMEIERKQIFLDEMEIHRNLEHPNIVKLLDGFEYEEKFYLLLEYCENKDLSYILKKRKKLKEIEVIYYITNLIKAIKYLHKKRIVHRDIKTANIFLTDKLEVKLGDFGITKQIFDGKLYKIDGTLYYLSPEIFEYNGYSFEVDIWAIGIIIYQLILGELPFYGNDKNETREKIMNLNYVFPENAIISNAAKDLIKQILVKDPNERPTLDEILQHDFFKLDYH